MPDRPLPLIGVSACLKPFDGWDWHAVQDKYVMAVTAGAQAQAVLIPAAGEAGADALLERLDGILLTGSRSNVEPYHYEGPPSRAGVPHDARRDATTLPLIRRAIAQGVPLLAICRGFQELNVALGGSLHQHLQEVPGRFDHRRRQDTDDRDEHYAPRHRVTLTPGGYLAGLLGKSETIVNSLHGQGVDRLSPRLIVEAVAEDGTVEAGTVRDAPGFALGLQWHAEWRVTENPDSAAIFRAFGDAATRRAQARQAK